MEGKRPKRIMILEMDSNTKETNKTSLDILYQADIIDYIKISIYFNKNLCKSYTFILDFYNKRLKNFVERIVEYKNKIQYNPIKILKSIKILTYKP